VKFVAAEFTYNKRFNRIIIIKKAILVWNESIIICYQRVYWRLNAMCLLNPLRAKMFFHNASLADLTRLRLYQAAAAPHGALD